MSFLFRPDMSYENIISESNMRTPRQQMKLWLSFIDCGYIFFFFFLFVFLWGGFSWC